MILLLIIALHILLLTRIDFFPYPELFIYSYLTSKGLLPYEQIIDQHFPGVMFFPINLYSLGLATPFRLFIVHILLLSTVHFLLYLISKSLFKGKLVLLPNILFLLWQPYLEGNVLWIENFVTPILLGSFYFLLQYIKKRDTFSLIIHGLLLGLALVFKQVVAPLIVVIGLIILIKDKNIKRGLYYILSVSLFPLIMFVYFVRRGIFDDVYYWGFIFNITTFAEMGRKYATLSELLRLSPLFGLALLSIVVMVKQNLKLKLRNLALIIFFLGSLVFAYARFDLVHLQPALPFAILLITLFFMNVPKRLALLFMALLLFSSLVLLGKFYLRDDERNIHFFGEFEQQLTAEVEQYADDNNSIFAMATTPHLYYLSGNLPPGNVFVFHFPWFMVKAEDKILAGIIADPPKVVVRDPNATTAGMRLVDYMPEIDAYVTNNYKLYKHVDNTEIWLPK